MSANGSTYEKLIRRYLNGRIPFRVWMFSSLLGSCMVIIDNLIRHNAPLEGFFSTLFINIAITIPVFLAQAHFVGLALQKNPAGARKILLLVLGLSWLVVGTVIMWVMSMIYESGWNSGAALFTGNLAILFSAWWSISLWTFRLPK